MHTRTAAAALLVAAGLALTACSSSSDGSSDKPTPAPTTIAAPAATAAATPSATPGPYRLGQPWHWTDPSGATGTTTVLAYAQPVLRDDPPGTDLGVPAGAAWGRLDIRVCQTAGPSVSVSQDPWHMQFADGSQADNTGLNGGDFPKPEFPQGRNLGGGQCARGGIMFPIPKGQRPAEVAYAPDSAPAPIYWTIPK